MLRALGLGLLGVVLCWGSVGCGDSAEEDEAQNNHAGHDAGDDASGDDSGDNSGDDAGNNAGNNADDAGNNSGDDVDDNSGDDAGDEPDAEEDAGDNNGEGPLEVACPVEACGGDVVGVWDWGSWCRTIPPEDLLLPECPEAVLGQEIVPMGTLSFGADGRYEAAATYEIRGSLLMPLSCLGGATCEALLASLNEEEDTFLWECATEGEACACERVQSLDGNQAGTYEVADGILTTHPEGEEAPRPLVYCVEGDTLQARDQGAQVTDPTFVLTRAR